MKIKFYHRFHKISDVNHTPLHYFYAATCLGQHNIEVSYCVDSSMKNRVYRGIKMVFELAFKSDSYDLLYASTANGLEILVLLKCLGFYKKPIVVWQHRALKKSNNIFVKKLLQLFYKGFDKMFMFTPLHIEESLQADVISKDKLKVMKWGPDLNYYANFGKNSIFSDDDVPYFCSTGRENRDFPTILSAFERLPDCSLKIYTTKQHGTMNNEAVLFNNREIKTNVKVKITNGDPAANCFLAKEVFHCFCVVICCYEHDYTVGLTSLFEAMALGKPVITSDNPYFPIDVEKENIGIKVRYGNVEDWIKAIRYLSMNRKIALEMGNNAKKLVQKEYNLEYLSANVSEVLISIFKSKSV